jgi:hypothetical protein
MQSKSLLAITCRTPAQPPGEGPRVRTKRDQGQLDRSQHWQTCLSVLSPVDLAQKVTFLWDTLTEGYWWDIRTSKSQAGGWLKQVRVPA